MPASNASLPGRCLVGTSGWSNRNWGAGRFYPAGLRSGEWLAYYATRFDTVELNMTFYRTPSAAMVQRWRAIGDEQFRFAVKLPRRITHEKMLRDCREELSTFLSTVSELDEKLGPILAQLPPTLGKDIDRLARFLDDFAAESAHPPRLAIEFRHPQWLDPTTMGLLSQRGIAAVVSDIPKCPLREPNDAPFVYIRRHGPAGRYRGAYTRGSLEADAGHIRGWLADGRDVYVYFNNTIELDAVNNASELRLLIDSG